MNSAACQAWLQDFLDGAADDGHLRDCAECAALYAPARRLRDALPALAPPRPRPGLSEGVVAEFLRGVRRRRRVRRLGVAACALAATVLLATGVRLYAPATPSPRISPPVVQDKPPPTAPAPDRRPATEPAPLRDAVAEAGSAVAALTSRTADEAFGGTRRLLPAVTAPTLDGLGVAPEPAARPLREAGEGVTAGLEPVTTSARRAVGLFLRDLPPVDNEAKPGL